MPRMFQNRFPRSYGREGLKESGPGFRRTIKHERVKHRRAVIDREFIDESLQDLDAELPPQVLLDPWDMPQPEDQWFTCYEPNDVGPIVHRGLGAFVRARKLLVTALVLLTMMCGCASNRRGAEVQVSVPDVNNSHPVVGATARVFVDFY